MLGVLLFLQATTPAVGFDLGKLSAPDCNASADEIVVCGSREPDVRYRLPPGDPAYGGAADPQVRFALPGGASLTPHGGTGRLGDARAMITITVPF